MIFVQIPKRGVLRERSLRAIKYRNPSTLTVTCCLNMSLHEITNFIDRFDLDLSVSIFEKRLEINFANLIFLHNFKSKISI